MKKTILLALAFLAGMLTINGAAQRGNNYGGKVGGFNFLSALVVVCLAAIMTACGGNLRGGGLEGKSVNDALPKGAAIWHPIIDPDGEIERPGGASNPDGGNTDFVWQVWQGNIVPCRDIKAVIVYDRQATYHDIDFLLSTDRYGGKYYPRVPGGGGRFWISPSLRLGHEHYDRHKYSTSVAKSIAEHCGVDLR